MNAETQFVTTTLSAIIAAGWIETDNYAQIQGSIGLLKTAWRQNYADEPTMAHAFAASTGAPAPTPAPTGHPVGVPSSAISAADMSLFYSWGQMKVGIGNKVCKAIGKPWKDCTWTEVVDRVNIEEGQGTDWTYLTPFLSDKLKNETAEVRETTSCAKAAAEEIRTRSL